MAYEEPPTRLFHRVTSSFRKHSVFKTANTVALSLPPGLEEDGDQDTVVPEHGIKPGMEETWFRSDRYGFRLGVQKDSIPVHPSEGQTSGPIKVSPFTSSMQFEGDQWEGVFKVDCRPVGTRVVAPLFFDFPVDAGNEKHPIMDSNGRIRYEVLTKDGRLKRWVRDPEGSIPLRIVKDDKGQTYVRAQVRHFGCWGLWKKLNCGLEVYRELTIPWSQRRKNRSVVKNITGHDIAIHIFAIRKSQWDAAVESVKGGGGRERFNAEFEGGVDDNEHIGPFAKIPQVVMLPSGHSHWLEIPRVGAGVWSSRKAAVVVATNENVDGEGKTMRMEGVVHLSSGKMVEVNLPVEDGKVRGSPAAAESGGMLSQVYRVVQNVANATPGPSPSTAGRSYSEPSSVANRSSRIVSSDASPTRGGKIEGQPPVGEQFVGSPLIAESVGAEGSPYAGVDGDVEVAGVGVGIGGCGIATPAEREVGVAAVAPSS